MNIINLYSNNMMVILLIFSLISQLFSINAVVGLSDFTFEGCFETNYVEMYKSYYKIKESRLSLDACLAECNNRLTTHMGLQEDLSTPTTYHVYCGNDVTNLAIKVQVSRCLPCQDMEDHTCGGPGTMSVYRLRDNTPLAAFLYTTKGVETLVSNKTTMRVPNEYSGGYAVMDYFYMDDAIFIVHNRSLSRSNYNYYTTKDTYIQTIVEEDIYLDNVAVDFLREEVYWTKNTSGIIFRTNLNNNTTKPLENTLCGGKYLRCDVYSRMLFYTNGIYVYRYNLETDKVINSSVSQYSHDTFNVAVDTYQQFIYIVIKFRGDPNQYLMRLDYNLTGMVVVHTFDSYNPYSFDVFNNTAVWATDKIDGQYKVYRCKLTPRCNPKHLGLVHISNVCIHNLKIFHPERQTPGEKRLCDNMACSHSCRAISPFTARCSCPPPLTLGPDNSTCIAVVGLSDLTLEGCFETNYVEMYKSYYKIKESPLSLEASLAACNNRLTTHMGLKEDMSTPTTYQVYCGNDVPNVAIKVQISRCLPCRDMEEHTCGGPGTMSVYRLRENTPLAATLYTNKGVEIMVTNMTTMRIPNEYSGGYAVMDYFYTDDAIFIVHNRTLLRSNYNYYTMKDSYIQIVVEQDDNLDNVAVDFLREEVYWTKYTSGIIYKTNLNNNTTKKLENTLCGYKFLRCDAYSRMLFYTNGNYVYRYNLETGAVINSTVSQYSHATFNVAVDTYQQFIYIVIKFRGDPNQYLMRLDYNLTGMVVVHTFDSYKLYSFDVFNNTAIWVTDKIGGQYIVYRCKLTPRCTPNNLALVNISNVSIYNLRIFHPERQTPGEKRLCDNMTCSHSCRAISPFTARCSCPPPMTLGPDNSTCIADASGFIRPVIKDNLSCLSLYN